MTVCPLQALQEDGAACEQDGVLVVRRDGRLHAFEATCPHGGVALRDATVHGGTLRCPRHGARFRLADGKVLGGPPTRPLTCFDVAETPAGVVVTRRPPAPPQSRLSRLRSALLPRAG